MWGFDVSGPALRALVNVFMGEGPIRSTLSHSDSSIASRSPKTVNLVQPCVSLAHRPLFSLSQHSR